tara:strand:- start:156 stop:365 length:210 start_codon:yes stop_codon:yes gene_type:complete
MKNLHPTFYLMVGMLGASFCFNVLMAIENFSLRKKLLAKPIPVNVIIDESILRDAPLLENNSRYEDRQT